MKEKTKKSKKKKRNQGKKVQIRLRRYIGHNTYVYIKRYIKENLGKRNKSIKTDLFLKEKIEQKWWKNYKYYLECTHID